MNPLENFYEIIDDLKSDGKVKLAYDRKAKLICVIKERNLQLAQLYSILKSEEIPYVPEIYRLVKFNEKLYVVEEYIGGRTLEEILKYETNFSEETVADITRQLVKSLQFLHACKIIHRDIKPSNIMLTKDGAVRLIDFGISRIAKDDSDTDTNFLGTRGYAPPEQYGFGQTDARSDIYSLGVLMQRLLGKDYKGWLKKIIERSTQFDPEKRYDSAEFMLEDLERRIWQQNLKELKKAPAPKVVEEELTVGDKLNELVQMLEDLDTMIDTHIEISKENPLQARLIENSALKIAEDFEKVAYSFTDEDFEEMHAALEEYPLESFDFSSDTDSDTK